MRTKTTTANAADHLSAGGSLEPLLIDRQLQFYFSIAPMAAAGNIFNALIICAFAYRVVPAQLLAFWFALVIFASVIRVLSARQFKRQQRPKPRRATLQSIHLISTVLGVAWGAMLGWLLSLPSLNPLVPAMVGAGMMSAAASTLSVLPRAAVLFVAPIACGGLIGFAASSLSDKYAGIALLASYSFVLWRSVTASYANFIARTLHEYELTEQSDTVRLLLNDYQAHSADWLWVVDAHGRLANTSARFADAAQRPAEILNHHRLCELFDDCPEREQLADHIANLRSFTDLIVPLTIRGEQHWWSLSAHPRLGPDRASVIGLRGVASNVTAARRAEAKIAYMAHYDSLTDLPNRFLFTESLQRSLHRRQPLQANAVLCLDLDQFKAVNDTLGHPVGDQLLQIVARRIESCIAEKDIAARLGGDEFAVLLCNIADEQEIERLAKRLVEAIAEPVTIDGHHIMTATSIGIALIPKDGATVAEILKNADLALYHAKATGRGRFSYFVAGMDETARERRLMEMDLRAALARGQISVHYQPLVNLETREVVGFEALMRWTHPSRGAIPPVEFIPIAEDTGLISQLGEWVIREAVFEVARWPAHLHVAVNLSPSQIRSPTLISTIVNALASAAVASNRLELEITESVLMENSETNVVTLHHLRDLGIRISLDDFGTGYSSLNYLRSFPFDKIKIDRCFIEAIDTNPECRAIVASVTRLAKELGMVTTAEGVETIEQLAELQLGDCTEAQGFLFSKPVPAASLAGLRAEHSAALQQGNQVVFLPTPPATRAGDEPSDSPLQHARGGP